MSVYVATPEANCEASRALRQEGVEFHEWMCRGPHEYGGLFYRLWARGRAFVVVEWDVIPSPGAIERLLQCKQRWCSHEYHLQPGHLANSFGIGKFVPVGKPDPVWKNTDWWMLDGAVVPVLHERIGRVHLHTPPLAHCKRLSRD
jgi:hypothetical protein